MLRTYTCIYHKSYINHNPITLCGWNSPTQVNIYDALTVSEHKQVHGINMQFLNYKFLECYQSTAQLRVGATYQFATISVNKVIICKPTQSKFLIRYVIGNEAWIHHRIAKPGEESKEFKLKSSREISKQGSPNPLNKEGEWETGYFTIRIVERISEAPDRSRNAACCVCEVYVRRFIVLRQYT
uniref:Uncharacterized protein n=1 Tax=Glossina pallidipes TaxID=7398 RepID=A0A1A9ZL06_GLOPL